MALALKNASVNSHEKALVRAPLVAREAHLVHVRRSQTWRRHQLCHEIRWVLHATDLLKAEFPGLPHFLHPERPDSDVAEFATPTTTNDA